MQLSNEQKDVIKKIIQVFDKEQIITLGGYAGVGKTTIIKFLDQYFRNKGINLAIAAYTGKATNVLRKKGLTASTVHGTIYQYIKDENGEPYYIPLTRNDLDSKGIDGFIIDECYFISQEIHEDLKSFGLPIIYCGDHGQLEPVGGTKCEFMHNPMFRLETIHRNAGEIARFAHYLRQGNRASHFDHQNNVQIVKKTALEDRHLIMFDQIICAFNKTRKTINEKIRRHKKIDLTFIAVDEKIICLRNNRNRNLYNGMQGVVSKIHKNDYFSFWADDNYYHHIKYDIDQFYAELTVFKENLDINPFDYAYAITAHKSQGDEFGSVLAYEEYCSQWDHRRWCYTVATRAKNNLIWAV